MPPPSSIGPLLTIEEAHALLVKDFSLRCTLKTFRNRVYAGAIKLPFFKEPISGRTVISRPYLEQIYLEHHNRALNDWRRACGER